MKCSTRMPMPSCSRKTTDRDASATLIRATPAALCGRRLFRVRDCSRIQPARSATHHATAGARCRCIARRMPSRVRSRTPGISPGGCRCARMHSARETSVRHPSSCRDRSRGGGGRAKKFAHFRAFRVVRRGKRRVWRKVFSAAGKPALHGMGDVARRPCRDRHAAGAARALRAKRIKQAVSESTAGDAAAHRRCRFGSMSRQAGFPCRARARVRRKKVAQRC